MRFSRFSARARVVEQDLEDPGAQRRAALEVIDPADDPQPGVPDDVLGDRATGYVSEREPGQRPVELVYQLREGGLVTAAQGLDRNSLVAQAARGHRTEPSRAHLDRPVNPVNE